MKGYRRNRRSTIAARCPCRFSDAATGEIELIDISTGGCRARIGELPLFKGQTLHLFPEGSDAFSGVVRNTDDGFAGIAFDQPLPHPVLERLRLRYDIGVFEAAEEEEGEEDQSGPDAITEPADKPARTKKPRYSSLASLSLTTR